MSKRAQHLAVRALPGLAAELRAYKRSAVRYWRERALEADRSGTPAARAYTWERYRRERAKSPAEFRTSYQSEAVLRITREPRAELLRRVCRGWRVVMLEART